MPALLRTQSPPGPPQHWLFGNLKEFGRDQLGSLTRWAREYGDLVSARFGPRRVVFANHPDLVEEILVNQHRKFIKHYTIWTLGREAIEPVDLGGYRIPAGITVLMPQWVIHRDPRWYDDPEVFRPERWADGLIQRISRYAYFPFGGGPRICIGNNFAMMEATLILTTIAQRNRMALAVDADIKLLPSMTLRPAHGIKVVLADRRRK